ncbi:MAG: hypothetical protein IPJ09_10250 [Saprospiraceae bacterium]|nr:hypothetical protein [Saprospiraceae bacterium]
MDQSIKPFYSKSGDKQEQAFVADLFWSNHLPNNALQQRVGPFKKQSE